MTIRPYRPADLAALRRICLLTGRAGTDATGQWSSDELLPDIFLEPFATLEPQTVWVVEQDGAPVGYLLGVLDTTAFIERWRREWTPEFACRHARVAENPAEQWLRDFGYEPDWMRIPQLAEYPAHLHIDLLPEAQGRGWGRALMRELGLAAVAGGVPGIHLVMSNDNLGAGVFYERLGFHDLPADGDARVLGIDPRRLVASRS